MKKIIIILCSLLLYTGLFAQEKVLTMNFWRIEDLYELDESKPDALPEGFQKITDSAGALRHHDGRRVGDKMDRTLRIGRFGDSVFLVAIPPLAGIPLCAGMHAR